MKKAFRNLILIALIFIFLSGYAHAVATLSGKLIKKIPGKRMIVIQLKSGTEKKVILAGHCKAYRMNQKAILPSFRIGETVVIKICSPLNANPLRAEILMDKYSSAQYNSFKKVTPTYDQHHTGGGFATTCGSAPSGLPPVSGVYPNATHGGWPNNNKLPSSVSSVSGSPQGGSMTAAPAPWGSPAIGDVLSGGGGNSSSWGTPSSGSGTISSGTTTGGPGSVVTEAAGGSGVTPNQGNWVVNPTKKKKRSKAVSFQGKVFQVNQNYNAIYVNQLGTKKTYTVMIRPKTKVQDFMTNQPLTINQIKINYVVNIMGSTSMDGMVDATMVKVQRR